MTKFLFCRSTSKKMKANPYAEFSHILENWISYVLLRPLFVILKDLFWRRYGDTAVSSNAFLDMLPERRQGHLLMLFFQNVYVGQNNQLMDCENIGMYGLHSDLALLSFR